MKLPDKVYDWLKWISLVVLDAIGTLYNSLATLWGWPYGEMIMKTCVYVSIFIGAIIGISTAEYRKTLK